MIKDCMRKVITVNLHQTIKVSKISLKSLWLLGMCDSHLYLGEARDDVCTAQVSKDLEIKAYYAGHVLGAAMFQIRVGDQSVVYTVGHACMHACMHVHVTCHSV